MKRLTVIAALVLPALVTAAGAGVETEVQMLSGHGPEDAVTWEFYCTGGRNSGSWTTIPVPSCWEQQGFGTYNYGVQHRPGRDRPNPPPLADEQGKYRREFTVPAEWGDRRVRIVFDGSMTDTEVWINGKLAGPVHQGSFYRFHYDITSLLKFGGTNLLEVTVSKKSANESVNRAERIGDYWTFGGIFKPVWLEARPLQAIDWAGIDARADGSFAADVRFASPATDSGEIRTRIVGPKGDTVATLAPVTFAPGATGVAVRGKAAPIAAWTAETPHLYSAQFSLVEAGDERHSVSQRFGFRTFEVRKEDGLYLNGVKIRMKGVDRHCFWPETGRTLSREQSYADARLIKEMNMNAVRMSHYPPDAHFLEACDELGLYVLDELAGWQGSYDTPTGARLIGEMIRRDVNHPSILFWDNGNEGGWNTDNDGEFAKWDIQQRPVLHPWEKFSGVDTNHYEQWPSHLNLTKGPMIYMPTEVLHGLYDGGHGAALRDYWNAVMAGPTAAGMFLWSFADEGVVRTDQDGRIDCAGNLAPDGIVGPHHEREGSFYAVKEIWSPVQIDAPEVLPADWDGVLGVSNHYNFTNLNTCSLRWRLLKDAGIDTGSLSEVASGSVRLPAIGPGQSGDVRLEFPRNRGDAGILQATAIGPEGEELWTYSASLESRHEVASGESVAGSPPTWIKPELIAYRREVRSFVPVSVAASALVTEWRRLADGAWRLDYSYTLDGEFDIAGIRVLGPETTLLSKRWLGRGPYRVWQNRMEGGVLDVHEVAYNDSTPGESWAYPEFKGFFRDWRWLALKTPTGRLTVDNVSGVPFFGIGKPRDGVNGLLDLPDVGLAFLDVIPPIGTKFTTAEKLGPQSQTRTISGTHSGTLVFRLPR